MIKKEWLVVTIIISILFSYISFAWCYYSPQQSQMIWNVNSLYQSGYLSYETAMQLLDFAIDHYPTTTTTPPTTNRTTSADCFTYTYENCCECCRGEADDVRNGKQLELCTEKCLEIEKKRKSSTISYPEPPPTCCWEVRLFNSNSYDQPQDYYYDQPQDYYYDQPQDYYYDQPQDYY